VNFWELLVFGLMAGSSMACVFVGLWILHRNRLYAEMAIQAMEGLAKSYERGFAMMTLDLDQMQARLNALEIKLGVKTRG
jgi:hypothetical protein